MQRVTVGWLAWSLTEQASFVGLTAFLTFAPTMVSGPFFGVLADRIYLRRAALCAQGGFNFTAGALAATHAAGALGPGPLAAFALLIGVIASAHHPIRLALAPRLADASALFSVVLLTSLSFNFARLFGPAIDGWIIARYGVGAALLTTMLCFAPLLAVLASMRRPLGPSGDAAGGGFAPDLVSGVRLAAGNLLIRRAMLLTGAYAMIGRGALEILPVIADGAFNRGPTGLGLLAAAAGAGALAASLAIALGPRQPSDRLAPAGVAACICGLALVALLGRTTNWPVAVAIVGGLGFASTITGVTMQSAVQMSLSDAWRGREMSLCVVGAIGGAAIGAIGLGALAERMGIPAALGLADPIGAVAVLGAIVVGRRH